MSEENVDMEATVEWMNAQIEGAKHLKDAAIEINGAEAEDLDIPILITGYREQLPVVSVIGTEMNDDISMAIGLLLTGCQCDQITVLAEGLSALTETNPQTGEPWEDNDMEYLVGSDPELSKNHVQRALFLSLINRPESPLAASSEKPHYAVIIPYNSPKQGAEKFSYAEEGVRVRRWGSEDDDDLSIPGVEFFLKQPPLRDELMADIEAGNAPITIWDLEDMQDEFGLDFLVDIYTVKQLNTLRAVKAAGLMFPRESPRFELFQRMTEGQIDTDPFVALGITAEANWKVKRLKFIDGAVEEEDL